MSADPRPGSANGLERIRFLILDMDGVLWRGDTPAPGLAAFFQTLERLRIEAILATNNASKTVLDYVAKLAGFGVAIRPERILTSGVATAGALASRYVRGSKVFVVGEPALAEVLAEHGFDILDPEAPLDVATREPAAFVVAAIHRQVRYHHLAAAALHINAGAAFYATNPDPSVPHELGTLPGAGAIQAALVAATGIQPVVVGKPGPLLFEEALRRLGAPVEATAMVGDRLETDIAGGQGAGLRTILLLSGVTSADALRTNGIVPDFVFADISELATALARAHGL